MIDLPPGPNGLFRLVDHRFEFQSEPMLLSVPWELVQVGRLRQ
jgi:hypothetical protein